ncbi:MAG: hypothetical protein AAF380_03465, partial [Bacteroidota bacterium]
MKITTKCAKAILCAVAMLSLTPSALLASNADQPNSATQQAVNIGTVSKTQVMNPANDNDWQKTLQQSAKARHERSKSGTQKKGYRHKPAQHVKGREFFEENSDTIAIPRKSFENMENSVAEITQNMQNQAKSIAEMQEMVLRKHQKVTDISEEAINGISQKIITRVDKNLDKIFEKNFPAHLSSHSINNQLKNYNTINKQRNIIDMEEKGSSEPKFFSVRLYLYKGGK